MPRLILKTGTWISVEEYRSGSLQVSGTASLTIVGRVANSSTPEFPSGETIATGVVQGITTLSLPVDQIYLIVDSGTLTYCAINLSNEPLNVGNTRRLILKPGIWVSVESFRSGTLQISGTVSVTIMGRIASSAYPEFATGEIIALNLSRGITLLDLPVDQIFLIVNSGTLTYCAINLRPDLLSVGSVPPPTLLPRIIAVESRANILETQNPIGRAPDFIYATVALMNAASPANGVFALVTETGEYVERVAGVWVSRGALDASVVTFKQLGGGPTKTAAQNRAALERIPLYAGRTITFAAGQYQIDNNSSASGLLAGANGPLIQDWVGCLEFEPGASFVFTVLTKRGLEFLRGTPTLRGMTYTYNPIPTTRTLEAIVFTSCVDPVVTDFSGRYSPSAGLIFFECIRPRVNGCVIRNSLADGLHFANCQDSKFSNIITEDTGDDGIALLNYTALANNAGGSGTNLTVRRSKARGITVLGQSSVTLSNFLVENTWSGGILVGTDGTFGTRRPTAVTVNNGIVRDAGQAASGTGSGNQFGIEYAGVGILSISDVQVLNPKTRGVSGTDVDVLRLRGVLVQDAPSEGLNVTAGRLELDGFTLERCLTGWSAENGSSAMLIFAGTVNIIDSGPLAGDGRVVTFGLAAGARTNITTLNISESRASAVARRFISYGSHSGVINNINYIGPGTFANQNGAALSKVLLINGVVPV